jgi:hypothetical protein
MTVADLIVTRRLPDLLPNERHLPSTSRISVDASSGVYLIAAQPLSCKIEFTGNSGCAPGCQRWLSSTLANFLEVDKRW